jgi:hypothetical protein
MSNPTITQLLGWTHAWFNPNCFAQIPSGFCGEEVPDKYIFESGNEGRDRVSDWNRERINRWWKGRGK